MFWQTGGSDNIVLSKLRDQEFNLINMHKHDKGGVTMMLKMFIRGCFCKVLTGGLIILVIVYENLHSLY